MIKLITRRWLSAHRNKESRTIVDVSLRDGIVNKRSDISRDR